ncbi:MAG: response regulator [Acidobacteria bacterium]|nr:response regulator [Acidobacteriota bacterium]
MANHKWLIAKYICRGLFVWLLCLGWGPRVWAQSSPLADIQDVGRLKFRTYSENAGLTDIHSIVFDQKGYLWVGTLSGPAYFNGRKWTLIDLPNKHLSNWVRVMTVSADGSLWFGTESGGLVHYQEGQMTAYTTASGLPNNGIRALLETKKADGATTLWAGTFGGGLACYEGGHWKTYDPSSGFPSRYVYKLIQGHTSDDSLVIWAGTSDGLLRFENGTWHQWTTQNSGLPNNVILSLFETNSPPGNTQLWIGTEKGIAVFENNHWRLFDPETEVPAVAILALQETRSPDGTQTMWVGTQGRGLLRFDRGRWSRFDVNAGLPNNLIVSLAQSQLQGGNSDTLWVGTSRGTLASLYLGGWKTLDKQTGLPNDQVYRVLESSNAEGKPVYWFATYGGLARFEAGQWSLYTTQNSPLPSNIVETLAEEVLPNGSKVLWVGFFQSNSGGLARFENGKWTVYDKSRGLPDNRVTRILVSRTESGKSVIWVATYGGGVGRFEDGTWTVFNTENGLIDNRAQTLLETDSPQGGKILWIGTFGGLVRYEQGKFTTYGVGSGLPNNGVLDILGTTDPTGKPWLWVGTNGGGLAGFDYDSPHPQWLVFSRPGLALLPSNIIFQIQQDARRRIYAATNSGVARLIFPENQPFSPETVRVTTFTTEDGLPSGICNFGASLVDSQERIWVGTAKGAAFLETKADFENFQPRPLVIEYASNSNTHIQITSGSVLSYRENHLTFEFACLAYHRETETRYQTQLVGFEEFPTPWNQDSKKEYTNLGAGNYVFQVWAKNHLGVVSGPVEFHFSITPAPWRTWWAYLAYTLGVILAALGIIWLSQQRLEHRNRLLETKIAERTAELAAKVKEVEASEKKALYASNAKSTFLANMSHELRTPLNAILGFAQLMEREHHRPAQDYDYLGIIIRSGEHLLSLINDVLSLSKIEAGKLSLSEQVFDLKKMLRSLHEMFQLRAEAKHLRLEFKVSDKLPQLVIGDESKLKQVLINLINNAIKFTEQGGVVIGVSPVNQKIHFEVSDTGVGISQDEFHKLFDPFVQTQSGLKTKEGTGLGLAISREIIRLMGGEIAVESEVGRGSTFSFEITLSLATSPERPISVQTVRHVSAGQPVYRMLIVDDHYENRLTLKILLESVGFEVQEAANGREAIARWETWKPHCIWLDLRMPEMDGYAVTRFIRTNETSAAKTVIVALSASVFEQDRAGILECGCDDFVTKPFREAQLFEKLEQLVGVKFDYEEKANQFAQSGSEPGVLTYVSPMRMGQLPPELLAELSRNLNVGDLIHAEQLIDTIREQDSLLAEELLTLFRQYRVEEVLRIIEQVQSTQ